MAAVSETIVREYFETQGFYVRQQRKFITPGRIEDDEIDFFVINPRPEAKGPLPFVLSAADLAGVARAVVVVKGWHTDTFTRGVLAGAPQIFRFLDPAVFQQATKSFGGEGVLTKLLVVPALPVGEQPRQQSIDLLRSKGLDGVILFHTMLREIIDQTEVNRNYQKSDLLQIIRILKNYDFFKEPQMELFKPPRARKPATRPKPRSAKVSAEAGTQPNPTAEG
jgi:hypothetical protein